ncbi:uracil-DNA glycosylase [Amaricoccus sp.]|uniref:uracil-DNA glycosylase n=1 Tax=Amaricoccus sp. TaxID=1872485 RepID=UPI001B5E2D9A|nr:uracil-DNA glycosylase [Amaricoccus sp.]MBP7000574.1 uracil-DNA glycosylase [Amaricoccus sp.]
MAGLPDSFDDDLAALAWQVEMGADEAIGETPVDRFEAAPTPAPVAVVPAPAPRPPAVPAEDSAGIAAACEDLPALRAAMAAFEGCALKRGARSLVFADGDPRARVMLVGEAPGREEDMAGLPFVGRSGQLLDRMLAAIGLTRKGEDPATSVYITNVLPWRPPANREPSSDEVAMMRPFLMRHIALKAPKVLVTLGSPATRTVLATATGINRLHGIWADLGGIPVLPMLHPAALLRAPERKREAWGDLLTLRERLGS